jgi:aminoglycoside phosphotransferase (APT) family kinase protein
VKHLKQRHIRYIPTNSIFAFAVTNVPMSQTGMNHMHNHRSIVTTILHRHFPPADWIIFRPRDGQQKARFIAQYGEHRVFVMLDVPAAALRRLGEIGVAPCLLADGVIGNMTYVVQEYIAGSYPDRRWFASNLPLLARFVRRYHNDRPLSELLSVDGAITYEEHIAADLVELEERYRSLYAADLHTVEIEQAFQRLKDWSKHLQSAILLPIHPDPNTKNMLLRGETGALVMVDWDEVQLSDPVRDVGLLLWWYVSRRQWSEFFDAFGVGMDEAIVDRIFWWAARTSFTVALWQVEHGHDCRAFLQDFLAALHKKNNPRA